MGGRRCPRHIPALFIARGSATTRLAEYTRNPRQRPAPTPSTFHSHRIKRADLPRPALAKAFFQPLGFYRKSDAKPVDSARQPIRSVMSYESRAALAAPLPWCIARVTHRSKYLLRRNKQPLPRLSNSFSLVTIGASRPGNTAVIRRMPARSLQQTETRTCSYTAMVHCFWRARNRRLRLRSCLSRYPSC